MVRDHEWDAPLVTGNVRSEDGELRAMFSRAPPLPTKTTTTTTTTTTGDGDGDGDGGSDSETAATTTITTTTLQYDPELRSPVWHTDQAFRSPPPFASLLYCHTAPPPVGWCKVNSFDL